MVRGECGTVAFSSSRSLDIHLAGFTIDINPYKNGSGGGKLYHNIGHYKLQVSRHSTRMGDTFRARDISLKAQKKLLSKMSNKSLAKNFIDDTLASILDNLYSLAKAYTGNKKEAEKIVKNIIKIVVKINILYRNDQFSPEDLKVANQLRNKFTTIVKTVISFFEVDFTFDKVFLTKIINDCRSLLKQLVGNHLTDKSLGRIDHVLDFFAEPAFLEEMFRPDTPHRPTLQTIVDDMSKAFDEGGI